MVYTVCCCFLCVFLFGFCFAHENKSTQDRGDITTCCATEDGCCGPDWGLHCCNFVAKICCFGDERVHSLHHHYHNRHSHWHFNFFWLKVTLYIVLIMLLISGILLCCKGRGHATVKEYTILPGYEYNSAQTIMPTAPVPQTSHTTDEYPLIDYKNGQPQGRSVNSNLMVPPPPYHEAV